mmetsp:Transcript_72969/g.236033  ORF Transcript_72969/g.236033 Transcript_72969/m.236033 type:complete len:249 (+) Transcript_72969:321-1067(+)
MAHGEGCCCSHGRSGRSVRECRRPRQGSRWPRQERGAWRQPEPQPKRWSVSGRVAIGRHALQPQRPHRRGVQVDLALRLRARGRCSCRHRNRRREDWPGAHVRGDLPCLGRAPEPRWHRVPVLGRRTRVGLRPHARHRCAVRAPACRRACERRGVASLPPHRDAAQATWGRTSRHERASARPHGIDRWSEFGGQRHGCCARRDDAHRAEAAGTQQRGCLGREAPCKSCRVRPSERSGVCRLPRKAPSR